VKDKLEAFDESGMGYRIVTVTLKDGRRYSNVGISDGLISHKFGYPDQTPFKLRDIVDVAWEGYRGDRITGPPTKLD
jgi:hypothetical protein